MSFDLQFLVNLFAIIGGTLGIIAFMDVRRKRYKLTIKRASAKAHLERDPGGAQSYIEGPAFEVVLINKGLVTLYPHRFLLVMNGSHELTYSPTAPSDPLVPGRSVRFFIDRINVYSEIYDRFQDAMQKSKITFQIVVHLEDDYICKSNVIKMDPTQLLAAP